MNESNRSMYELLKQAYDDFMEFGTLSAEWLEETEDLLNKLKD